VTIYTAAPQDLLDNVIPAFEKSANVKVELIKGGSGDLINRLKAEKGRQAADVLFSVSTEVIEANAALFSKFTPDNVKYLSSVFKVNDAAVPFTAVANSFGVNTKQLTPAQYPKTWVDLGNPMYKGKISAGRPDKSGSAFIQLALILQIYGEDKGWDVYGKILDNTVLSNSSGAVSKFVNDGEALIGLSNEDTLLKFKAGGGPVDILYPTDGTSALADSMALTATPANAEGGKAFINFMLSREAQEILDGVGRRTVRSDVVSKNQLTPLNKINVFKYNDDWAGANRARILAKFNEMLLNKK
jgi:iron(III) transport system substrate-binding protein